MTFWFFLDVGNQEAVCFHSKCCRSNDCYMRINIYMYSTSSQTDFGKFAQDTDIDMNNVACYSSE